MRNGLWVLAFLLLAAWLAILSYLFKDGIQLGKLALGDIVNIVALFLAAFSLFVAIAAYRDTTHSSAELQKTLDASRGALEVVVERATKQQQLLERTAGTLDTQLSLLQEQTKRELERLGRRPIIEIASGEIPWSHLRTNPAVPVAFEQPWHTFDFLVPRGWCRPQILFQV